VAIHSSEQTIFSLTHIEGITLGAGEEVNEVVGGASGMGVDRIGEVGDRASEGQAAWEYGGLVLTSSRWRLGGWWKVTEGEQGRRLRVEESDKRM
jgi:hypothetical protein